jgi:hypothetical protein
MDVDPEDEPAAVDPGDVKEEQEEADQGRIAVNEGDAVAAAVRLVLRALAPVGDSPGTDPRSASLAVPGCATMPGGILRESGT